MFHLAQLKGGYIFLLDLDGFKRINDSLGHDAGDQLLKQVANRFSRVIPTGAQIARLGGDEVGVIAQVDQLEAFELAQAIKATLSYPVTLTTSEVAIDVSIGYASIDPTVDVIDALRRADLAMYQVKEKGGGPVLWEKGKFEKIG